MGQRIAVYNGIPADDHFRCQWNGLVKQTEHPAIFYTWEWAKAAATAFTKLFTPLVVAVHDENELVGLASMARELTRPTNASFLAGTTADYCNVLSSHLQKRGVLHSILNELKRQGIRNVDLRNLPDESVPGLMATGEIQRFHCFSRLAYRCKRIVFGDDLQRTQALQSLTHKTSVQRSMRRLSATGPIETKHLSSWQDVRRELPAMFQAHIKRFRLAGERSHLIPDERRQFLTVLAELLCRAGWLRLSVLRLGDQTIAWHYGFEFAGTYSCYLATFLTEYEQFSPGTILLTKVVEQALSSRNVDQVDLGLGNETYKSRFANSERSTCELKLSRSLHRHVFNVSRDFAAEHVRSIPALETPMKRFRSDVHSLVERFTSAPLSERHP